MKSTADKREREKRMVSEMIALYCRKKHHTKGGLCPECADLEAYARMRSDKCPFMETKTFCSNCKVHCYKPVMREKIREVMRFSGPRMLFSHPVMAVSHVIESKKEKNDWRNQGENKEAFICDFRLYRFGSRSRGGCIAASSGVSVFAFGGVLLCQKL